MSSVVYSGSQWSGWMLPSGEHDADRLLDALEDTGVHLRLVAFRRAVDHPDVITGAAEVIAPFPGALSSTKPVRAFWTVIE